MKQEQTQDQTCSSPRVDVFKASKDEIIRLFDWYDFRDSHGAKLTLCLDFHDLLSRALGEPDASPDRIRQVPPNEAFREVDFDFATIDAALNLSSKPYRRLA